VGCQSVLSKLTAYSDSVVEVVEVEQEDLSSAHRITRIDLFHGLNLNMTQISKYGSQAFRYRNNSSPNLAS